jgi:hypothetical protein
VLWCVLWIWDYFHDKGAYLCWYRKVVFKDKIIHLVFQGFSVC